ncbi:mitogen-activated protein kinase kinase kinase 18-like [Phoenix dactylifera]|uniref:Mitogen-activated protein kinase kinase kinase 18-like n=1 Tax=Phoenix dactylifera TaxID=42345 RepID=A0A8B7MVH9_PHODC|nr:mitogen-activated protein kinase kinase kinase 18-like [Phoenix dactylifera]
MGMVEWCRGRTIGRGSSATVSLATVPASGEVFAVKSAEIARAGLLQREQRILSNLNSPHVVSYLGCDVTSEKNGVYYNLFTEYAARGSLSDEIKKQGGCLDEPTIRSYSYHILRGLAYLHSSRIAHCDVKGQNVLIGSDGRAIIADLGCARRVAGDEDDYDDDDGLQLRGTPMFMAPEVARGEEQGIPADIWALGCTIVEMATGHAPWPEVSDPIAALHRIAFSSDVPELPSWISDEGKDFSDKCLRRDPKERWTAEQLLNHPFVASSANSIHKRISPKSTLDQAFWDSLSDEYEEEEEEDEEEDGNSSDDPSKRIQLLVGGGTVVGSPNWTWDDSWMTIRTDGREGEIILETEKNSVQIPVDEPTGGDPPTNPCVSRSGEFSLTGTSGGSSSSSSEEFILSTNHMDSEEDYLPNPRNYYGFINDFNCNSSSLGHPDEGIEKLFRSCKKDVITFGSGNCNPINQRQRHSICVLKLVLSFVSSWLAAFVFYFLLFSKASFDRRVRRRTEIADHVLEAPALGE